MQMGQHYTRLDNFEQALDMFHKALTITKDLTSAQQIQTVYSHLCRYYAEANDYEMATLHAYKSLQVHNQEGK